MYLFYKNFDTSEDLDGRKPIHSDTASEVVHKYHRSLHARNKWPKLFLGYLFVLSICLLFVVVFGKVFLGAFTVSIWRFAGFYFVMLFLSAKKLLAKKIYLGRSMFLPKDFLFLTSLIVVMWVYGTLSLQLIMFKVVIAVLIWFVFFFVWAGIVKESNAWHVMRLFFTKLYLTVLAIFVFVLWVQAIVYDSDNKFSSDRNSLGTLVVSWFSWQGTSQVEEPGNLSGDVFDVSGEVLSLNLSWSIATEEVVSSEIADVLTPESTDVIVSSGDAVSFDDMEPENDDRADVPALPTLMDVLIYLMDHYSIPLSPQKNISFTYVSPKNPYYPQFRTAYENLLIWKNANPSKNVLCQTYVVMKWLLEDWDVGSYTDIKSTYRKEAQEKWVLNGCKWNFYVKNTNL